MNANEIIGVVALSVAVLSFLITMISQRRISSSIDNIYINVDDIHSNVDDIHSNVDDIHTKVNLANSKLRYKLNVEKRLDGKIDEIAEVIKAPE